MKQNIFKESFLTVLFVVLLFSACQQDYESHIIKEKGNISFSFELNNQSINQKLIDYNLKADSQINPVAITVTLINVENYKTIRNKRLILKKEGSDFITEDLKVETGTYRLKNYALIDKNNKVVAAMPCSKYMELNVIPYQKITYIPEIVSTKIMPTTNNQLKANSENDFIQIEVDYEPYFPFSSVGFDIELKEDTSEIFVLYGDGSDPVNINNSQLHCYSSNDKYSVIVYGDIASLLSITPKFDGCITDISFSGTFNLEKLNIDHSILKTIDISALTKLKSLIFNKHDDGWSRCELSELDLSKNIHLDDVDISSCSINNLDLSNNTKITRLDIQDNPIDKLDISKNIELEYLNVKETPLKSINLSKNRKLEIIDLSYTNVTKLDITNNISLISITWPSYALQTEHMNYLYNQLFIHANTNNISSGFLATTTIEPTTPEAIKAKELLENKYNWMIIQRDY